MQLHVSSDYMYAPGDLTSLGPFTRHKKTQIRSENVRINGTHKTDPTSMWDQSGCLLHPSKCVGSI
jgi:hypothetical protein